MSPSGMKNLWLQEALTGETRSEEHTSELQSLYS